MFNLLRLKQHLISIHEFSGFKRLPSIVYKVVLIDGREIENKYERDDQLLVSLNYVIKSKLYGTVVILTKNIL